MPEVLLPKTSTYTEFHKKSYHKRRDTELVRMLNYYHNNKERMNAQRKVNYHKKKLERLTAAPNNNISNSDQSSSDSDNSELSTV